MTLQLRPARLKNEELRALLAGHLAEAEIPSRLPTVREFASRYGASVGAVQQSLSRLEAAGAVSIESRRGSGTVLTARSLGALWAAAKGGPLVVALPLPLTRRLQGLATGIKASLAEADVETFLIFSRGSRGRLRALREGRCHAVVMSALAASTAGQPGHEIALDLPVGTLASGHMVFERVGPRDPDRRLRVGLDRDSVDLQRMTELEFGTSDVEYVDATYMQFAELFRAGAVDAAVWDNDDPPAELLSFVTPRPFSAGTRAALGDLNTRASVVVGATDRVTAAVVRECLAGSFVLEVQQAVVSGLRLPEY